MGAYFHLQGLAELDKISNSNSNEEIYQSLSQPTSAASEVSSIGILGVRASNATTNAMEDCSDFWAGQLDDVFEELQVKTGSGDVLIAKTIVNGTEQNYVPKVPIERGLDRREKGDASSRQSIIRENACVENRAVENLCLVDHGGPSAGLHESGVVTSSSSASHAKVQDYEEKGSAINGGHKHGKLEESGSIPSSSTGSHEEFEDQLERLPDHLLIELLVRVPTRDWPAAACVKKRWAQLFSGDGLWHSALMKKWPGATSTKRWPGPIARGSNKRRYTALYISDTLFPSDKVEGVNEVAGHIYLFLKEQLESLTPPVSYGLLHGTVIDQFLACCKTGDEAHNLASHVWIAVLDNLDDSENTFRLLMRIAEEWEVFPGYPYSRSHAVQWRLFERLFTDFRDCLSQYNYFDVLTRVRNKFEMIPGTWLGY